MIAHPDPKMIGSRYRVPRMRSVAVGRAENADLRLSGSPSLSRHHATFRFERRHRHGDPGGRRQPQRHLRQRRRIEGAVELSERRPHPDRRRPLQVPPRSRRRGRVPRRAARAGDARWAHRRLQPPVLRGGARAGGRARARARVPARGGAPRPRRLQAGQRPARARDRRPGAARGGRGGARVPGRRAGARPRRRRGVRLARAARHGPPRRGRSPSGLRAAIADHALECLDAPSDHLLVRCRRARARATAPASISTGVRTRRSTTRRTPAATGHGRGRRLVTSSARSRAGA